jgi:hypothetical protein
MLKYRTTWWRGAGFYRRRFVDRWIVAGGIDRFSITYSSGFIVWISVRANPDDQVVVNEVSIGGRVGLSIGSVVAGCLTAAWNVVAEFLRLRGNSMPIVVVRRASCSWAGCSRSSSHTTLLIVEPGAQDRHHTPLFLLLSRVLKIVVVHRCEWRRSEQELHARWKFLIVDPQCHEFIRTNLSTSPLPSAHLSTSSH